MRLRSALLVSALIVTCLLAALIGPAAPQAVADGPNRAVVVADSGTGVIVRGIEFEVDSVSGLEALELAGLSPVIQGFQGEGGAVCAVAGVGSVPGFDSERSFMGICPVEIFAHLLLQGFGTIGKRRVMSVVPTLEARR